MARSTVACLLLCIGALIMKMITGLIGTKMARNMKINLKEGKSTITSEVRSNAISIQVLKRNKENFGNDIRMKKSRNRRERGSRSNSIAQQKVARLLRDELSDIITTADVKVNNYPSLALLAGVSIPEVEFSSDFSYAKVHVSVAGNSVEKRQVYVWLCNNIGQVRHSLSQRLRRLRRVPDIRFTLVDSSSRYYLSQTMDDASFLPSNEPQYSDKFYNMDEDFEFVEDEGEEDEFW